METTPNFSPALLAAWAEHTGCSLEDDRIQYPDECGWPNSFAHFRAGWDAGRDKVIAERDFLKKELAALIFAAHMPEDYRYGLPSWICQRLYTAYIHQARNQAEWDVLKRALDERDEARAECEQLRIANER